MPDKSIVATLLNGAIRTSEQEEMAHLLRRKSQFLIAYGSCAATGGIPGLANQFSREQILKFTYEDGPTMVNEAEDAPADSSSRDERPRAARCPELRKVVRSLDQVVDVDYYLPGCPPTPKLTKAAVGGAAGGQAAAQGHRAGARHRALRRVPAQGRASPPTWRSPSSSGRTRC